MIKYVSENVTRDYVFITKIITSQSYVGGTNFEVTRVCACLHELLIIGSG